LTIRKSRYAGLECDSTDLPLIAHRQRFARECFEQGFAKDMAISLLFTPVLENLMTRDPQGPRQKGSIRAKRGEASPHLEAGFLEDVGSMGGVGNERANPGKNSQLIDGKSPQELLVELGILG